jgi:hypothetical protein
MNSSIISFDTFKLEKAEWSRFARWVIPAILVPIAVMFFLCETLAWRLGEFVPAEKAAEMQMKNPNMLWMARVDSNQARFKLFRLAQERPTVLVMGQSRACQFRTEMFRPYSFYNLSQISWPYETYCDILRRFPEGYNPKVIIFNLDFFMFNPRYTAYYKRASPHFEAPTWTDHFKCLRDVYITLCGNPADLWASRHNPYTGQPSLGLRPSLTGEGFRSDGSITQPLPPGAPFSDTELMYHVAWNKTSMYYYGDSLGEAELKSYNDFVSMARSRGIALIGVRMPVYDSAYKVEVTDPRFGIVQKFSDQLAKGYFERDGVIVFNYAQFPPYTASPNYFPEAGHPSAIVSAAVLYQMASDPRVKALLPDLDVASLKQKLDEDKTAKDHFSVYDE